MAELRKQSEGEKIDRAVRVAASVFSTSQAVTKHVKEFNGLSVSKFKRNVFTKKYNRRPLRKQKRALVVAKIALSVTMGAMQTITELSKPVPKYAKGGQ